MTISRPACFARATRSRASFAVVVIGFSTRTWQPFASAADACSWWSVCGEEMTTPSIGTASSIARKSSKPRSIPNVSLHLLELGRAEAVDRDDLAVGILLQHRDMVGDRPPAGADDRRSAPCVTAVFPMASSVERCTLRICTTMACSAASASRAENAATIASWSASDWLEHAGGLRSDPPIFHAEHIERMRDADEERIAGRLHDGAMELEIGDAKAERVVDELSLHIDDREKPVDVGSGQPLRRHPRDAAVDQHARTRRARGRSAY